MAFDRGVAVNETYDFPDQVLDRLKITFPEKSLGVTVEEDPSHPGFAVINFG